MGWLVMSDRALNRGEVLAQVDEGRFNIDSALNILYPTRRQVYRLLKRNRQHGALAIRHKMCGKPPNNRMHHANRDFALSVNKESYADFALTLAADILAENHGLKASHEMVCK